MAMGASVAGTALGSSEIAAPSRSSTPSASSLAAQLVAQGLVIGADEDVVGDVGDRDVLVGKNALISPASSRPDGPAPTISARSAASSASWAARCRALAEAMSGSSVFAGNGYADPVASTR